MPLRPNPNAASGGARHGAELTAQVVRGLALEIHSVTFTGFHVSCLNGQPSAIVHNITLLETYEITWRALERGVGRSLDPSVARGVVTTRRWWAIDDSAGAETVTTKLGSCR